MQLRGMRNAGVREQLDDVALFVFGVKEGTCPPGARVCGGKGRPMPCWVCLLLPAVGLLSMCLS